jgi:flagellar protein FlgJ
MNISALISASPVDTANIPVEDLVGNQHLSQNQKIAEASRQFEAIMLRQILSEAQKPVFTSEFTDNSTAAGIYQDLITNSLADSMSKSGTLGMAKIFEQQLTHPGGKATGPDPVTSAPVSATTTTHPHPKILAHPVLYPVSPPPHE